jgi:hypothetical protein
MKVINLTLVAQQLEIPLEELKSICQVLRIEIVKEAIAPSEKQKIQDFINVCRERGVSVAQGLEEIQRLQQEVLGAAKSLEAQESKFLEYVTRNDYSPGVVTNPGLLQAAILEGATRYRNRVIQNQNNPQSPSYNLHEEIINNGSEIEALKRINLGASVKEAELRYIDPATNTWTVVPLDSAELVASGLVKLNIITNSRNGINQKFELITIAQNTRKALDEIKSLRLASLRSKGLAPIASELDKIDWFGNKAKPQEAGISNYGKLDEQPTLPPEPKPSIPKN